jgi:endo-1,4-beta-xylanase
MKGLLSVICMATAAATCAAQTLRQEADQRHLLIGAAVNEHYLSEPAYTSTLAREFNMVEAETAMKWTATQPSEKIFDFTAGDQIVSFAELHGMKIRGHNLLWHSHNPEWLTGHYTPEQLSRLMQEHIERVVSHYRGKVFAWDVVNEAIDENGKLRDSIWYNQPGIGLADKGTAYIAQAFRWAHATDPDALLFYNDADADELNRHSDTVYAMVKDFKDHGVPIDGIGLQMHLLKLDPDFASIAANIARFTKLGVQVHITEMDVSLPVDENGALRNSNDLARQAEIYRKVAQICVSHPGCTALQFWGFTDKYSWIPRFTHYTKGDALLFDRNYKPKPAYEALRAVLAEHEPAQEN